MREHRIRLVTMQVASKCSSSYRSSGLRIGANGKPACSMTCEISAAVRCARRSAMAHVDGGCGMRRSLPQDLELRQRCVRIRFFVESPSFTGHRLQPHLGRFAGA